MARKFMNKDIDVVEDNFNFYECVGTALWAFGNMRAVDPTTKLVRALITNGNMW